MISTKIHWIHPELAKESPLELSKAAVEILANNMIAKKHSKKELKILVDHLAECLQVGLPDFNQTS